MIQTPRQRFVTDLFLCISGFAGLYSLGITGLFKDLWDIWGVVLSIPVFLTAGITIGGVISSDFTHSLERKLNQKENT